MERWSFLAPLDTRAQLLPSLVRTIAQENARRGLRRTHWQAQTFARARKTVARVLGARPPRPIPATLPALGNQSDSPERAPGVEPEHEKSILDSLGPSFGHQGSGRSGTVGRSLGSQRTEASDCAYAAGTSVHGRPASPLSPTLLRPPSARAFSTRPGLTLALPAHHRPSILTCEF